MTSTDAEIFAQILKDSGSTVFFGGAGVSTESGIPDFRSESARRATLERFGLPAEEILSASFFSSNPEVFYEYAREFLFHPKATPNAAHRALAHWEERGLLAGVITQNIDGLHQKAGSKEVWEVHGTLEKFHCVACTSTAPLDEVIKQLDSGTPVPTCTCGAALKPDVVLYGESLPDEAVSRSVQAVSQAEVLIVCGTSLSVFPAAGLVNAFRGSHIVLVNLSPTPADYQADLIIREPIGQTLSTVEQLLQMS
ncbi:NAD-dependent protein deacylase [Actinomycetaceae bacterium WB03_NA08]|uniref:protein acetyllysine N-acetyltransferase n=1 Tax=Scrofimicrobium canadense TaxID=2652290 RepID=A0A6N7W7C6_9ACTO|nr:NAD-dependent protein deacylase [Scrofimicrobium canadense]MSS85291.1 NAD-dependent protein deacylase [Scrofimicrobium canadense]